MSETTSNLATADLYSSGQPTVVSNAKVSPEEMEFACVNLISQFENQIDSAKSRSSHVEDAGTNADKLLSVLLDFVENNLSGEASTKPCMQAIEKCSFASLAHKEGLNSLGWGFAISNLFGKSVCSDERVRQTYGELGDALLTTCVTVLRQAVATVGSESETAKSIEQSTAVFVEEFKANW